MLGSLRLGKSQGGEWTYELDSSTASAKKGEQAAVPWRLRQTPPKVGNPCLPFCQAFITRFNERSVETALIAQRISALFESGQAVAVPSVPTIVPTFNYVNMTVTGLTSQLNRPVSSGSSPFQLGINLNLELEHGKPNTVRVPQGELMLMYLPQIRNPNGGAAVELSHSHLQKILAETSHPSSMVMLPTGGLLLMSLTPYSDTDSSYRVKGHPATDPPGFQGPLIQDLNTVSRQQQQQMQMVKQAMRPNISTRVTAATTTPFITTTMAPLLADTGFKYPAAWKNKIPKFPYVPPPQEEEHKEVPVEEQDTGPVFPHRPRLPLPPPLRLNLTWPHTTALTTPRYVKALKLSHHPSQDHCHHHHQHHHQSVACDADHQVPQVPLCLSPSPQVPALQQPDRRSPAQAQEQGKQLRKSASEQWKLSCEEPAD